MAQMKFREYEKELPAGTSENFQRAVSNIFDFLSRQISNRTIVSDLLQGNKVLERTDTPLNKAPEDLTEEVVIKPLFDFLGYPGDKCHRRTSSGTIERKEADYTLLVGGTKILIEAEPLNKDLLAKGCGVDQVESWAKMLIS